MSTKTVSLWLGLGRGGRGSKSKRATIRHLGASSMLPRCGLACSREHTAPAWLFCSGTGHVVEADDPYCAVLCWSADPLVATIPAYLCVCRRADTLRPQWPNVKVLTLNEQMKVRAPGSGVHFVSHSLR